MTKSRRFFMLLSAVLLASLASSSARAAAFFHDLDGVPLMPGLQEQPEGAVAFDKPEGRIAEGVASSRRISISAMRAFYRDSLPQLGWRPAGPDRFVREDEILSLHFSEGAQGHTLRVTVTPTS